MKQKISSQKREYGRKKKTFSTHRNNLGYELGRKVSERAEIHGEYPQHWIHSYEFALPHSAHDIELSIERMKERGTLNWDILAYKELASAMQSMNLEAKRKHLVELHAINVQWIMAIEKAIYNSMT